MGLCDDARHEATCYHLHDEGRWRSPPFHAPFLSLLLLLVIPTLRASEAHGLVAAHGGAAGEESPRRRRRPCQDQKGRQVSLSLTHSLILQSVAMTWEQCVHWFRTRHAGEASQRGADVRVRGRAGDVGDAAEVGGGARGSSKGQQADAGVVASDLIVVGTVGSAAAVPWTERKQIVVRPCMAFDKVDWDVFSAFFC